MFRTNKAGDIVWDNDRAPGVAAERFELLGENYGKSDAGVWYQRYKIEGARPAGFEVLNGDFARDDQHVYFRSIPLRDADPATFEVLGWTWAKDAAAAYWQTRPVPGCDTSSFEALNTDYARDRSHVYDLTRVVVGADPQSFAVFDEGWAKDAERVWHNGVVQEELDAASFTRPDAPKAVEDPAALLKAEAQAGNAEAAFTLSENDELSTGFFWLHVAANLGHPEAPQYLEDFTEFQGWGPEVEAAVLLELARYYKGRRAMERRYLSLALDAGAVRNSSLTRQDLLDEFPWADALLPV